MMWFTATHCLSSTCPACFADALLLGSSGWPPLPFAHVLPMSSLNEMSISPSGCSFVASKNELNGSITWYTRPCVSKSRFGSVVSVQLGGIACVPVLRQSYPWIWLLPDGAPFGI